jgi:hypothetical protein
MIETQQLLITEHQDLLASLIYDFRSTTLLQTPSSGGDAVFWTSRNRLATYAGSAVFDVDEDWDRSVKPTESFQNTDKVWNIQRFKRINETTEFEVKTFLVGYAGQLLCFNTFENSGYRHSMSGQELNTWSNNARHSISFQQHHGLRMPSLMDLAELEDSIKDFVHFTETNGTDISEINYE